MRYPKEIREHMKAQVEKGMEMAEIDCQKHNKRAMTPYEREEAHKILWKAQREWGKRYLK